MIYVRGVVSFLSNNKDLSSIVNLKSKNISLKILEGFYPDESDDSPRKVACAFTASLPRSFECKSLEDYTGKVKPFLQKSIRNVIVSVEVSDLNYKGHGRYF